MHIQPVVITGVAILFVSVFGMPSSFSNLVEYYAGVALGFSYAQTRNLLTPITIHAFWNSGVILLLTFLQVGLVSLYVATRNFPGENSRIYKLANMHRIAQE